MYMHLGSVPTLVVTSPKLAEAILKTNDRIMASRPDLIVGKILSYGQYWRYLRKICMSGFLAPSRIRQFQEIRQREVLSCLHFILGESERGNPVQETYQEMFELLGAFSVADYVPFLKPFDPQGFNKRTKDVLQRLDGFWEMIIEEHRQRLEMGTSENYKEDFVDVLLGLGQTQEFQERLSVESMKALLGDLLAGASDIIAVTSQWVLTEVLRHPQVMKRVQDELDSVVGHRLVREEDLPELRYLHAVIKETMRLHPAGPLMIPHESTHDCEIEGFHIPARTRVFVNVWGIHRDPAWWERPQVFDPDRFLNCNLDFKGQDFRYFPFGSGRRMCLGSNYGVQTVTYFMAMLLRTLDWTLSKDQEPEELDVSETFGAVLYKKLPLAVFGKARLPAHVIYPAQEFQEGTLL